MQLTACSNTPMQTTEDGESGNKQKRTKRLKAATPKRKKQTIPKIAPRSAQKVLNERNALLESQAHVLDDYLERKDQIDLIVLSVASETPLLGSPRSPNGRGSAYRILRVRDRSLAN